MANVDFPSGFKALRNRNGSFPEIMVMDCVTTVLYDGALAFLSNTGLVQLMTSSVVSSTLAKRIAGVFANGKAAGAVGAEGSKSKIRVYTDPDQLYSIQTSTNALDTITEVIGVNVAVWNANGGNSTNVRSITELNGAEVSSVACGSATNAEICQILQVEKGIGNSLAASTSWTRFVVRLNGPAHLQRSAGGQQ